MTQHKHDRKHLALSPAEPNYFTTKHTKKLFILHYQLIRPNATTIEKEAPKLDEQQFDGARQRVDGKPQVCPELSEG
jgi:hypothetical protein